MSFTSLGGIRPLILFLERDDLQSIRKTPAMQYGGSSFYEIEPPKCSPERLIMAGPISAILKI